MPIIQNDPRKQPTTGTSPSREQRPDILSSIGQRLSQNTVGHLHPDWRVLMQHLHAAITTFSRAWAGYESGIIDIDTLIFGMSMLHECVECRNYAEDRLGQQQIGSLEFKQHDKT